MNKLQRRLFTQEEYLDLEDQAEFKSQYIAGEIFWAHGEQPWHIQVSQGLMCALHTRFRRKTDCHIYASMMRVRVSSAELLTYPDVVALKGEPRFERLANSSNLLNPQVICEVSSPSTHEFDRGDKFSRYRQLDSLTDYVLADSEKMRIEHRRVQADGSWLCEEFIQPTNLLKFVGLDCEIPLAEIYEGVTFPEAATCLANNLEDLR